MLVIEGPDNLGKTTACRRLVEIVKTLGLKAEYRHMSRPNECFDWRHDYLKMMSPHYVQDRFHIGSILWHEKVMSLRRLQIIDSWICGLGGLVVLFYASDEKWYENSLRESKKEEMFSPDNILRANRLCKRIAESWATENVVADFVSVDFAYDVSRFGFADDRVLRTIADEWILRRLEAGNVRTEQQNEIEAVEGSSQT